MAGGAWLLTAVKVPLNAKVIGKTPWKASPGHPWGHSWMGSYLPGRASYLPIVWKVAASERIGFPWVERHTLTVEIPEYVWRRSLGVIAGDPGS